jgi:hypothetical protein
MIINIASSLAACAILIAFLALLIATPPAERRRAAAVRVRRDR